MFSLFVFVLYIGLKTGGMVFWFCPVGRFEKGAFFFGIYSKTILLSLAF